MSGDNDLQVITKDEDPGRTCHGDNHYLMLTLDYGHD
jgi:hypothetical protein